MPTTLRPKKIGVNKTANSENIFKTDDLINTGDPFMSFENQHPEALKLTFIRWITRFFAFL